MKSKSKIVRRGKDALPSASSDQFLKLADGDSAIIAPLVGLDQLISLDRHEFWIDGGNSPIFPCLQSDDCPGCVRGDTPRYRAFLPVLTKADGVKIFNFGVGVSRDLADLEAEVGSIQGLMIKIKRTGSGLKTRWTVMSLGKRVKVDGQEIPDIEKTLGSTDIDEIEAMMAAAGLNVDESSKVSLFIADDDEAEEKPKAKKVKAEIASDDEEEKPKAKKAKVEVVDDDWDTIV